MSQEEPFSVGQEVLINWGIEQGHSIALGTIVEVVGEPYTGTLIVESSSGERKTYQKRNGQEVDGPSHSYIRLAS